MANLSLVDGQGVRLARWSGRPTLFALAVINALTGLMAAVVFAPTSAGVDAGFYRTCAMMVLDSPAGCTSLYPPITAVVARPLTWVSPEIAAVIMTMIGVVIMTSGILLETRGRARVDRVLVAIAVLGFTPVVREFLLGQVTFLLAAALYPVIRRKDGYRNGIALGIVLALAPKPLLMPVLVWMLVWRRRGLAAAILTALAVTGLGLLMTGPEQYGQWLSFLTTVGRQSAEGTFGLSGLGNLSLWPLDPFRVVMAVIIGAGALWAILRDPVRGFVAALVAGLLLSPYTMLYAFTILLLVVKPALDFAPRATRVLALTASLMLAFLPGSVVWGVGVLIATLLPAPTRLARPPAEDA